jgi:BMFP domain-containing protein YqiC
MEGDEAYATDLTFIRKMERPTLQYAVSMFTTKAGRVENKSRPSVGLTGLHTSVQAPPAPAVADMEARLTATLDARLSAMESRLQARAPRKSTSSDQYCHQFMFTGKCKYGDKCKFPHKTKSKGCAECGGPHDVAKCPKRTIAALEARIAKLEAQGSRIAELEAQLADAELASIVRKAP